MRIGLFCSTGAKQPNKKTSGSGKIGPFTYLFFIDIYCVLRKISAEALIFYLLYAIVCIKQYPQ